MIFIEKYLTTKGKMKISNSISSCFIVLYCNTHINSSLSSTDVSFYKFFEKFEKIDFNRNRSIHGFGFLGKCKSDCYSLKLNKQSMQLSIKDINKEIKDILN
jgi:hypothetical protein